MSETKNKGDVKDLTGASAVKEIRELAEEKISMFCTSEQGRIVSRPMATQKVDDDGNVWFLSAKDSSLNRQIAVDNKVYLMYADNSGYKYLSLSGSASITQDKQKIHELWNKMAKAWFEEGEDDPNLSVIKVALEDGHYWDTKNGKLVSLIKIAVAAVTGKGKDGGIEGDISL